MSKRFRDARFTGSYEGNKGQGELVEMFGFGVATVDDQLRPMFVGEDSGLSF